MTARPARLRQDTLALVDDLIKNGRIGASDARLFIRAGTVYAALKSEDASRELARRAALPWWKRWLP